MNKPLVVEGQIQETNWRKCVWKLQTSPKIKLLIWKVFHGALPVGEQLLIRNVATNGKCKACGMPESINHLFFECSFVQKVWTEAPLMPNVEVRGPIDLETTWTNICARINLPPTGVTQCSLAPWILWQIWIARNNAIFNDRWLTPADIVTKAVAAAREWEISQMKQQKKPQRNKRQAPLPDQCIIVRSEAAWKSDCLTAGLGWTITDNARTRSFSTTTPYVVSPLIAEGLALREAIWSCKQLGFTNICCESDSTLLVQAVNAVSIASELYGITADIFSLADFFNSISFRWISRESNSEADGLAKQCLTDERAIYCIT